MSDRPVDNGIGYGNNQHGLSRRNLGYLTLFLAAGAGYVALVAFAGPALWRAIGPPTPTSGRVLAGASGIFISWSVIFLVVAGARTQQRRRQTTRPAPLTVAHWAGVAALAALALVNSLLFFSTIGRGRGGDASYAWFTRTYPGASRWAAVGFVIGLLTMFPMLYVLVRLLVPRPGGSYPAADRR